jgi:nucleoside-diphosphate-sugar epimerase
MSSNKNVLIIGGNGYIGSYLYNHLSKKFNVVSFGSKSKDYYLLQTKLLNNYDYIILLAGHSSVKMCDGDLKSPWLNNVCNFKDLVKKTSAKIIYASSASVYGVSSNSLATEDDINLNFVNNYDLTKAVIDLYSLSEIQKGREIVGLRFGTVNGSSPILRKDLMINAMVGNALSEGIINVSNKHIKRPLLFIRDLALGMEKIIESKFVPGIYNLCSLNSNVDQISKIVSDLTGVSIIDNGETVGAYNFEITSNKFFKTFDIEFATTIQDIVVDVVECYKNSNPKIVSRDEYFNYKR